MANHVIPLHYWTLHCRVGTTVDLESFIGGSPNKALFLDEVRDLRLREVQLMAMGTKIYIFSLSPSSYIEHFT